MKAYDFFPERGKRASKLFDLLVKQAPNKVFLSIVLGVMAGLCYAMIIPLILSSLELEAELSGDAASERIYIGKFQITTPRLALFFFGLCMAILLARSLSVIMLNHVSIDATVALRAYLYRRISAMPIEALERIGPSRLVSALNVDVPRLIAGARVFPLLLINLATLIGLLGFLVYLNIHVFYFILAVIGFGIVTYRVPLFFAERFLRKARNIMDRLQEGARGLIHGAKELKLNRQRRHDYIESELASNEEAHMRSQKVGSALMITSITYGDLIAFFAIGVVTYAFSGFYSLSPELLAGIVMSLLYLTGPVSVILNSMIPVVQANVSLRVIQKLLNEMPIEQQAPEERAPARCRTVKLEGVMYLYPKDSSNKDGFAVGPVSATFKSGQVSFLVGGNGSGKTTLAKILSLHYMPAAGQVYLDDERIDETNRDRHRQCISAIYSDFYLFPKLFGFDAGEVKEVVARYLRDLMLTDKVSLRGNEFSTINLSDGQRKRLALLMAYLEDRSIYLFDEWAADQDPNFKEVFYNRILPDLKRAGKIVIIISHDDRYFHSADQVIKLENGKVISAEVNQGMFSRPVGDLVVPAGISQ